MTHLHLPFNPRLALLLLTMMLASCAADNGNDGGENNTGSQPSLSLNDTGITTCSDNASNGLTCPQATHPGQDAELGRDAQALAGTLSKVGGGRGGFDFTKLDANGDPLVDQTVDYATNPWSCVQDNHTGLLWEVKTIDGGLRDVGHTYTWYNSTGVNDGGDTGTANGGSCVDANNCDTEKYMAAVNAEGLCGKTNWRLPQRAELRSLVDYSIAYPGPTIDADYFPNTKDASRYWSAANNGTTAWFIAYDYGSSANTYKNVKYQVRLVHNTP